MKLAVEATTVVTATMVAAVATVAVAMGVAMAAAVAAHMPRGTCQSSKSRRLRERP